MRKRIFKYLNLVLVVCISLSIFSPSVVYASDEEYKSFSQLDSRWGGYVYGGGETISYSGCVITSVSVLMAYANPDLRDVNTFNPQVAASKFRFDGAAFYWDSTANADPTFTYVGKIYESGTALSESEANAKVKEQLDAGNYVIIKTIGMYGGSTHYSPIVGYADGKPIVWDVAGGQNSNWDTWANLGIYEIVVYSSSKNKSYDVLGKSDDAISGKPETEEEKQEVQKLIEESGLTGMPEDHVFATDLEFPDYDVLSNNEKANVDTIKESIEVKKDSWFDIMMKIVSVTGLFVILYGVLFVVCYMFDRNNSLFDLSLFNLITLGKYKVWDEVDGMRAGEKGKDGIIYCDSSSVVKSFAVIEVIGFLLISGKVFELLYHIAIWLADTVRLLI